MDLYTAHLLAQIETHTATVAEESGRTRREVSRVRREVSDLITWVKRIAILAALYGGGLVMILASDEKAELIVKLIRASRG